MKKLTLKIALTVMLATAIFAACKKKTEAPVVVADPCASITIETYATEIKAAQDAFGAYQADLTNTTKCRTLKTAADVLYNKVKDCPTITAIPQIKSLIDQRPLLNIACP